MSQKPRRFSPKEITRTFEVKLEIKLRNGKERTGWYCLEGKKIFRVSIPHIHKRDWSPKVQKKLCKVTMLVAEDYEELVSCTMSGRAYAERVPDLFPDKLP